MLTVYEAGAPGGPVILSHNGTPFAGPPLEALVEDARVQGTRLICYDRPGYCDSTADPGRSVGDAAADCAAIMDALGVERFVTWGISGGGPHALACAALLPERVVAVASLAGVALFDAEGLNHMRGMAAEDFVGTGLAMAGREYLQPFREASVEPMRDSTPARLIEAFAASVSAPDRVALSGPVGEYLAASSSVSFAQGAAGWVDDELAFVAPFGFEIGEVRIPALVVHGVQDRFVPVAHGRWLAGAFRDAEAWILEDDGHLSLVDRIPSVHQWLLTHL